MLDHLFFVEIGYHALNCIQAENRLHTQKALLVAIMRGDAAFDELGA